MNKSIVLLLSISALKLAAIPCNGQEEFCNKRYNEIYGQLKVHNAASYYDGHTWKSMWQSSIFGIIPNPVADQSIPFQEQLADTEETKVYPRVFKLPLHPRDIAGNKEVWITHTLSDREFKTNFDTYADFLSFWPALKDKLYDVINNTKYKIDATNMSFNTFLQQLKTFLDTNPQEVITLLLNVFDLQFDQLAAAFRDTGIYTYIHVQNQNNSWPTLQELINTNKRLIVFQDTAYPQTTQTDPWIAGLHYDKIFIFANRYDYKTLDSLQSDFCNVRNDTYIVSQNAFQTRNTPPYNKLFDMSHMITPGLAGDKSIAQQANKYAVILGHIKKCLDSTGKLPNFITIDFYNSNNEDIHEIQNDCNEPGIFTSKAICCSEALIKRTYHLEQCSQDSCNEDL